LVLRRLGGEFYVPALFCVDNGRSNLDVYFESFGGLGVRRTMFS